MTKIPLLLIFFSAISHALPTVNKSFRPWWSETLVYYDTFHSIGNFNESGALESLPSANSFWETAIVDVSNRYSMNKNYAFTTAIDVVQAQANIANSTTMSSGLRSLRASLEYKTEVQDLDLILEGLGSLSLFRVSRNSSVPIYGDGSHNLGVNIWLLKKFYDFQLFAQGGYLYRTEGLSSLMPYSLGVKWRIGSFILSSGISGFSSVSPDLETQDSRTNLLNKVNAGSMNYRSFNPSRQDLDLQAKWFLTKQFSLIAGGGNSLSGRESSSGTHFFLGIDVQWQVYQQPTEKNPLKNALPNPQKYSTDLLDEDASSLEE